MATMEHKDFYVPTINVAPYLKDPKSEASLRIIEDVRRACLSTGFFQLTGHGISKELQKSVFDAAKQFFRLPSEEKQKLDCKKTVGYRGYDALASQSYEEGVLPDLKEGFYVGDDIPFSHALHGRFFSGPNVWPPSELLPAESFQKPCERYFEALHTLTLKIIDLVGASLVVSDAAEKTSANGAANGYAAPMMPSVLRNLAYLDAVPACPMRLLHYPAVTMQAGGASPNDMPQYGASAHTDFGAITLLLQDDNPGLEVLDTTSASALATGSNIWRPIDPNPDAYVVNIGDIMDKITGGVYKSSVHRVVCKRPENDRYSIVFFFDGCLDARLDLLESPIINGHANKRNTDGEEVMTVEQHMVDRLMMSYGGGKKGARRDGETVVS